MQLITVLSNTHHNNDPIWEVCNHQDAREWAAKEVVEAWLVMLFFIIYYLLYFMVSCTPLSCVPLPCGTWHFILDGCKVSLMHAFGAFHKCQSLLLHSGECCFFLLAYVFLLKNIHDGDIGGLLESSNGRSCEQHACCGSCVWVGESSMICVNQEPRKQRVTKTRGWQAIAC